MEIRQAISMYLKAKALDDTEFKEKFENPQKNLDECVAYITYKMYEKVKQQVEDTKKGEHGNKTYGMACTVPSDDEIFALAEQYYRDDDLKVDGVDVRSVKIVSYAATSFTDEEKQQMRQDAIKKYQDDVIAECKKRDEERKKKAQQAKKPASPILIPDSENNCAETAETPKEQAVQMDLFG